MHSLPRPFVFLKSGEQVNSLFLPSPRHPHNTPQIAHQRIPDTLGHRSFHPYRRGSSVPEGICACCILIDVLKAVSTRVSKNAVFGLNFLPGFWTRQYRL